jgi:hypothetical protein
VKSYEIEASINPEKFQIDGREKINFVPEYDTDKIYLHLYWNGLSKKSLLYKDAPSSLKSVLEKKTPSKITISSLTINNREKSNFHNEKDPTLIKVKHNFTEGKKYSINIAFKSKIPEKRYIRFGYSKEDKTYWLSQWFPKIAVLTGKNQWDAKPFSYNYEFFHEYSDYSLKLTIPKEYKVITNLKKLGIKTKAEKNIYRAKEKNISDCVVGISKNFYTKKKIFKKDNLSIYLTNYKKIPEEKEEKIFERAHFVIKKLSSLIGPYKYDEFKIVNLSTIGDNGSGMEYPKLVHIGSNHGDYYRVLDHEIAHQWFYGMIGFNQTSEGWLDEGYASYYEIRLSEMDSENREAPSSFKNMGVNNFDFHHIPVSIAWIKNVNKSPEKGNIFQTEFNSEGNGYKIMFLYYMKHPIVLKFLESEVGKKNIDDVFKQIYNKYLFKHPNTEDILSIFKKNLNKKDYKIFNKNLRTYAKSDVAVKKENGSFKIIRGKDYTKKIKVDIKKENTEQSLFLDDTDNISAKNVKYLYLNNLDYNLGNNFFINSIKHNLSNYIYAFLLLLGLYFIIKLIKHSKITFLSKNILYNSLIFTPLFIYIVQTTFSKTIFNKMDFDFSYITAVINRIVSNPPIIISILTGLFFLIKISISSTFYYRKKDATYSIFSILILDLVTFLLTGLYIFSLFITKSFSIFLFMLFILAISLIEPIKIYFLRKDPRIITNLPMSVLSHFAITLIYTVLLIMILFMTAPFFLKFPFSILIFIAILSILEQIYRWGTLKITKHYIRKDPNES